MVPLSQFRQEGKIHMDLDQAVHEEDDGLDGQFWWRPPFCHQSMARLPCQKHAGSTPMPGLLSNASDLYTVICQLKLSSFQRPEQLSSIVGGV